MRLDLLLPLRFFCLAEGGRGTIVLLLMTSSLFFMLYLEFRFIISIKSAEPPRCGLPVFERLLLVLCLWFLFRLSLLLLLLPLVLVFTSSSPADHCVK